MALKLCTSHLCEINQSVRGHHNSGGHHAMEQLAQWLICPWVSAWYYAKNWLWKWFTQPSKYTVNSSHSQVFTESTRHKAVIHDGQLVARFSAILGCDKLTSQLVRRVDWQPRADKSTRMTSWLAPPGCAYLSPFVHNLASNSPPITGPEITKFLSYVDGSLSRRSAQCWWQGQVTVWE